MDGKKKVGSVPPAPTSSPGAGHGHKVAKGTAQGGGGLAGQLHADREEEARQLAHLMWYHGNINRTLAETKLRRAGCADGLFLLRDSAACSGDFVVSVAHAGKYHHFQTKQVHSLLYKLDVGPETEGLDGVVDHYRCNAHGLPCRLDQPCLGSLPPPLSLKRGFTNLLHTAIVEEKHTSAMEILGLPEGDGVDVNSKNRDGSTALHLACMRGHDGLVRRLLSSGASVTAVDSSGHSPLQVACMNNRDKLVRLLLERWAADPQFQHYHSGNVALHEAALRGNTACVGVLLQQNVPVWPRNDNEKTPYELAVKYGHHFCAQTIDEYTPPPAKTKMEDWFHTKLDRKGAMALLKKHDLQDGMFLLRPSSRGSTFVLTLTHNCQIYNFEIIQNASAFFTSKGPMYPSLEHVVQHYAKYNDGLRGAKLCTAVAPDGSLRPLGFVQPTTPGDDPAAERERSANIDRVPTIKERTRTPVGSTPIKLPPATITLGDELGQGEYGSVLRGTWTHSPGKKIDVAIKTLNEDHITQGLDNFLQEAEVMVRFDHPCIVKLIGVCDGPPFMLVQELLTMGALLDYLLDYPEKITKRDLYTWAAQVACGMDYLETEHFVHRDLATRNILLASRTQAKVGDFGLSRSVGASEYYRATTGGRWPVKWYAPESINYGTFSHASDVWSYGVTLWEMFTFGDQPYGDMKGAEVLAYIEHGRRLEMPDNCPDEVYKKMTECWQFEPAKRPGFQKLYKFFSKTAEYMNCVIEQTGQMQIQ